ncbi:MAG TPA: hypothetical protein VLP43_01020 [Solirubrobacteraceae bacterium]|nr:hypothetical protein [Solirubrobacteraceae bacterium]
MPVGFEHDPSESAVAQRLARQVIDRDQAIREDSDAQTPQGTPADREIHNLLALPIYLTMTSTA